MDNWNYDLARKYVDGIGDPTTRRLSQLFLTRFYLLAFQRYAVPENSSIDLLCFVKIMEKIADQHDLIKKCIEGVELDSAWETLADELEKHPDSVAAG